MDNCKECGLPLTFSKSWEMEGRKNPKTGKGTKLEISLYKCENGHNKRVVKKL
jgi:hypothetical protein